MKSSGIMRGSSRWPNWCNWGRMTLIMSKLVIICHLERSESALTARKGLDRYLYA